MKTNKHQTLLLVKEKTTVRARDIVEHFSYSAGTARSYLSYLSRTGLLVRSNTGYNLSEKGAERLAHFETVGCASFDCPRCDEKKSQSFICPRCGHELDRNAARIAPDMNIFYILFRSAGVYCPLCQKLLYTEEQAELIGIRREDV